MNSITKLANVLQSLLQKQRVECELDEELEGPLEASAAHKRLTGMTAESARWAALAELGRRNVVKHQVWSSRRESILEGLLQDTRLSVRTLAKSPWLYRYRRPVAGLFAYPRFPLFVNELCDSLHFS